MFGLLDALDGPFFEGWFRRFCGTRVGRRVLDEDRDLLSLLADRAFLATLPAGSLGRAYDDFVGRENLSPETLVEASTVGEDSWDTWGDRERIRFAERLRDQHDLEHVVTGYGRDEIGETELLAFDLGQSTSLGLAVLAGLGWLEAERDERRRIIAAFRRGRRSAWLPATDWENLIGLPLVDVRSVLGVGEPPHPPEPRRENSSAAA